MKGYAKVPTEDWLKARFDCGDYFYAFPKYDGIRLLMTPAGPRTCQLKELPNRWVREMLHTFCPTFYDGELILAPGIGFHDVQSELMTQGGTPQVRYMVFDNFEFIHHPFCERVTVLEKCWSHGRESYIQRAPYEIISDFATLQSYEEEQVSAGLEGVILRHPQQPYKCGRSTLEEAGMLKLKRFIDDEALIIGFKEMYINKNDPEINLLGLQERAKGMEGMIPAGTLGAFVVSHQKFGTFFIGTGFDRAYAKHVWDNQYEFLHKRLTFIYQPHGVINKPRCPRFKWIRKD